MNDSPAEPEITSAAQRKRFSLDWSSLMMNRLTYPIAAPSHCPLSLPLTPTPMHTHSPLPTPTTHAHSRSRSHGMITKREARKDPTSRYLTPRYRPCLVHPTYQNRHPQTSTNIHKALDGPDAVSLSPFLPLVQTDQSNRPLIRQTDQSITLPVMSPCSLHPASASEESSHGSPWGG